MNKRALQQRVRDARAKRASAKLEGTTERPRLSIFRSNRAIAAQLIDDTVGKTIVSASSMDVKEAAKKPKTEVAKMVGGLIAERAKKAGITKAIFDRRSYAYHGRVKAVAEGAREGGLTI